MLEALAAHGATATFFVLLTPVRLHPGLLARVLAEGHEVGLHGIDHRRLTQFTHAQVLARTAAAKDELEAATGTSVRWFRPPHGALDLGAWLGVRRAGLEPVLWGPTTSDWRDLPQDERVRRSLQGASRGAVVLAHDAFAGAEDGEEDDDVRAPAAGTSRARELVDGVPHGPLRGLRRLRGGFPRRMRPCGTGPSSVPPASVREFAHGLSAAPPSLAADSAEVHTGSSTRLYSSRNAGAVSPRSQDFLRGNLALTHHLFAPRRAVALSLTLGLALTSLLGAFGARPPTRPRRPSFAEHATGVTADALPTAQINATAGSRTRSSRATPSTSAGPSSARPAGAAAGTSESARYNLLAYALSTGTSARSPPTSTARSARRAVAGQPPLRRRRLHHRRRRDALPPGRLQHRDRPVDPASRRPQRTGLRGRRDRQHRLRRRPVHLGQRQQPQSARRLPGLRRLGAGGWTPKTDGTSVKALLVAPGGASSRAVRSPP